MHADLAQGAAGRAFRIPAPILTCDPQAAVVGKIGLDLAELAELAGVDRLPDRTDAGEQPCAMADHDAHAMRAFERRDAKRIRPWCWQSASRYRCACRRARRLAQIRNAARSAAPARPRRWPCRRARASSARAGIPLSRAKAASRSGLRPTQQTNSIFGGLAGGLGKHAAPGADADQSGSQPGLRHHFAPPSFGLSLRRGKADGCSAISRCEIASWPRECNC